MKINILLFTSLILFNLNSYGQTKSDEEFPPGLPLLPFELQSSFIIQEEDGILTYRWKRNNKLVNRKDLKIECPREYDLHTQYGWDTKGTLKNGVRHGKWIITSLHDQVTKEINYVEGIISGKYKVYIKSTGNDNGKVIYETEFVNGNGYWKDYMDNGETLLSEGRYVNGKKNGKWLYRGPHHYPAFNDSFYFRKVYYEKGKIIREEQEDLSSFRRSLDSVTGYEKLLMDFNGSPAEVHGWLYKKGYLQFQLFTGGISRDTIVITRTVKDQIELCGGISLDGYERFENMQIIGYQGIMVFAVTLRNGGNANGNDVKLFHIDIEDGIVTPIEVSRPHDLYPKTLSDGRFIWNQERIEYTDHLITSRFYIWNESDTHQFPTGGRTSVIYDIEKLDERRFRMYPERMKFEEGTFNINEED